MGAGVSLRWVSFECTLRLNENISVSQSHFLTSYLHHSYPYSPATFGSDAAYGSMKRLASWTVASTNCEVYTGATVFKVSSNLAKPLNLNEIEIYDENGNNIARNAKCYSSSSSGIGDPNCLNDGGTGWLPSSCTSQSSEDVAGNFDFCVLPEEANISAFQLWPAKESANNSVTNWLRTLTVEIFASLNGLTPETDYKNVGRDDVKFVGLLATIDMKGDFGTTQKSSVKKNGKHNDMYLEKHVPII